MPQKLFMDLNNSQYNANFIAKYKANLAATKQVKAPASLNAGMVDRIHSVRPGCGSCGK